MAYEIIELSISPFQFAAVPSHKMLRSAGMALCPFACFFKVAAIGRSALELESFRRVSLFTRYRVADKMLIPFRFLALFAIQAHSLAPTDEIQDAVCPLDPASATATDLLDAGPGAIWIPP